MYLEHRWQAIFQLHFSEQQSYRLTQCVLHRNFDDISKQTWLAVNWHSDCWVMASEKMAGDMDERRDATNSIVPLIFRKKCRTENQSVFVRQYFKNQEFKLVWNEITKLRYEPALWLIEGNRGDEYWIRCPQVKPLFITAVGDCCGHIGNAQHQSCFRQDGTASSI